MGVATILLVAVLAVAALFAVGRYGTPTAERLAPARLGPRAVARTVARGNALLTAPWAGERHAFGDR